MQHISWVYEKALERSRDYGIEGVTYQLTQGVVKNIIPAIASTNAIIAGICTLETLKIISMCSTGLDNMLMYVGTDSVYTLAARYEKDGTCVCCAPPVEMMAACSDTLEALVSRVMDKLSIEKRSESFSLSLNARILYSSKKGCVFQDTSGNLSLTLGALGFAAGTRNTLNINDKSLENVAKVTLLIE
jgi:ubiquitin-activating enzyme E1 C